MTGAKPSLPKLSFMHDAPAPAPAKPTNQVEVLLAQDRELKAQIAALDIEAKSQISTLELKRADIKSQLAALGESAMDRWYFQEYQREFAENDRREVKRRQRRAAALERDEAVAAMQANPARRELLRNLINNADLGKGNGKVS
jgi:hypothetical protein